MSLPGGCCGNLVFSFSCVAFAGKVSDSGCSMSLDIMVRAPSWSSLGIWWEQEINHCSFLPLKIFFFKWPYHNQTVLTDAHPCKYTTCIHMWFLFSAFKCIILTCLWIKIFFYLAGFLFFSLLQPDIRNPNPGQRDREMFLFRYLN